MDPVDLVEDRHPNVARSQEVRVQRVDAAPGLDRASRRDQRLPYLAAEHPLPVLVGRDAPEDVHLDRLEVEQLHVACRRPPGTSGHPRVRRWRYGPAHGRPEVSGGVPVGDRHRRPSDRGRERQQRLVALGAQPRLGLQGVERRLLRQLAPVARGRCSAAGVGSPTTASASSGVASSRPTASSPTSPSITTPGCVRSCGKRASHRW